jgi:putative phosphoesterase
MLQAFEEEKASQLILLGDLYYHGPRNPLPSEYNPQELSFMLREIKDKLTVIRGNCDSDVDEEISGFPFLPTTTLVLNGKRVTLSHGHIYNINYFPPDVGAIFLYGHVHTSFIEVKDGVLTACPGSVSLPKNDSKRSYLVLDEKGLILKDILTREVLQDFNFCDIV